MALVVEDQRWFRSIKVARAENIHPVEVSWRPPTRSGYVSEDCRSLLPKTYFHGSAVPIVP